MCLGKECNLKRIGQKCPTCERLLEEKDYPNIPWHMHHDYWLCKSCWSEFEHAWGSGFNPVNGSTIGLTEWVENSQKGRRKEFEEQAVAEANRLREECKKEAN